MANLRQKMLLLLLAGLYALQGVVSQEPFSPINRLPSTITPKLYMIQLDPDMDTGVVKGSIKIEVVTTSNQTETLDSIKLHCGKGMTVNVSTAIIKNMDGTLQLIGGFIYDDSNTLLILKLPEGQTLNHSSVYLIILQFQTFLNVDSKGLFMGNYNSTSKYIASNFRPTYARDVFPCFDEPHFKVPIALQVWRPASYYAISTAPLAYPSTTTAGDKVLDTFANTEPISIHSLGLFISQQPPVESMGVQVIVPPLTPISVPYLTLLISDITSQLGPFPINPLYLIVLPDRTYTSFSSYGFIFTSPEVYLGEVDSQLQAASLQLQLREQFLRQFLEFSKTPQWWSELWLSESVGAFLSISLQQISPMLRDWLNMVIRSEALGSYISESGPVITTPDLSKWDIENIINNQTVKFKGLSTLLMWNATMPEGLVKDTLMEFLRLKQSVVNTTHLVSIMVKNINSNTTYNVTAAIPLLPNWVTQPGSPLVWFSIDSDSTFTLVQGVPCSAGSPTSALRSISVALAEGSTPDWQNTLQGHWLLENTSQYTFVNISQSSVINIETAPYRVIYPDSQWLTLIQALSNGWAPASVASALQDDAIALSLGGCLNFSIALSILNSTQHSSLDWWTVVKASEAIIANIGDDSYGRSSFGLYFATLFTADLLDQLDMRDSANYSELSVARELVTPWLCQFNISTCREAAVELGGPLWQGNTSGIAGSDLENVACYGARYTPGALQPLMNAYKAADSAWLRRYFTIALSCLTDQDSVSELLNVIININSSAQAAFRIEDSQATLNQIDARQILIGLASNLENSQIIMNFILNQSEDIQEKFGVSTLSSVIKNLAKNRINLSQLSSLLNNDTLDIYVRQSASEAIATNNISQTWYNDYSQQLYKYLPAGIEPSSSTVLPTVPWTSSSKSTSPAPTQAPGSASTLSGCTVFVLALSALFITLNLS